MTYTVIMAGGNGTRLWPRVRTRSPKHLLCYEGKTLLERAVERAIRLVGKENVLVTTNENLLESITDSVKPLFANNIYSEPAVKDTGPAIGLMAARIAARDPEAVVAFLPADHVIRDEGEFHCVLRAALQAGQTVNGLVVIGVEATEPRTCYGYIKRGDSFYVEAGRPVYKVGKFREKPRRQRAEGYIRDGRFLWNTGIVIGRAGLILKLLGRYQPRLGKALERIGQSLGQPEELEVIREVYTAMDRISFDYAVLEKSSRIYVVTGDFGWEDIGSWSSLARVLAKDTNNNVFTDRAVSIDTRNCLVEAAGKLTATIGVSDLIVIDTDDVLFICHKDRDQEVKGLLKRLREAGWDMYL